MTSKQKHKNLKEKIIKIKLGGHVTLCPPCVRPWLLPTMYHAWSWPSSLRTRRLHLSTNNPLSNKDLVRACPMYSLFLRNILIIILKYKNIYTLQQTLWFCSSFTFSNIYYRDGAKVGMGRIGQFRPLPSRVFCFLT